jgi:hypothetical protein
MPITQNRSTDLVRRQSFNGKGLTFVEVIFDDALSGSATTPEALDSAFDKVTKVVNKNGTMLGASYRLAAKATVNDAAEVAAINANDSIDSYQYVVEGTPGQYNAADSVGDINMDVDATIVADAESDLESDILASLDISDSAGNVHVKVRTLLPEGHVNGDANSFVGMFDQRGDA